MMPMNKKVIRLHSLFEGSVAIFLFALAVRLLYISQVKDCPLFRVPTVDAFTNYELAKTFAQGHILHPLNEPYWQPAFYSLIMAAWMKLVGFSVANLQAIQILIGSFNCVLIYAVASRIFGKSAGKLAGAAAAIYAPMVYFDGELLTPTVQIAINLVALQLLLSTIERRSALFSALAGLALGISVIIRPDVALFAIFVIPWLAISFRGDKQPGRSLTLVFAFVVALLLPVATNAFRNKVVGHDNVIVSSNGGVNFYIGNNPNEELTRQIRPGKEWDQLLDMPLKEKPALRPSEKSAWFYHKAFAYALANPYDFSKLMFKKTMMFFSAVEGRRNNDIYHYRSYSWLYSMLLFKTRFFAFPLGIIIPLSFFGLVRCRLDNSGKLLVLYLFAQALAVIAFFVTARYRITAVPVMLIFGAVGLRELLRVWADRSWISVQPALLGTLLVAVVCNLNVFHIDQNQKAIDAETFFREAAILNDEGRCTAACGFFEKSIRLNPDYELARITYAQLLIKQSSLSKAKEQLNRCLNMDPSSVSARCLMGDILSIERDFEGALSNYAIAVEKEAAYVDRLMRLTLSADEVQRYDISSKAWIIIDKYCPNNAEIKLNLGNALVRSGDPERAVEALESARKLSPSSTDVASALDSARQALIDRSYYFPAKFSNKRQGSFR